MAILVPIKAASSEKRPLWKNPTLVLLGLTGAVDAADARVLPALFRALEKHFDFGPERLSMLMIAQSLSMALSSPFWGHYADGSRYSRPHLLAMGCTTWGVATIAMGWSSSFVALFLFRSLAGVALSCLVPLSQSMVADMTPESKRGSVFGVLDGISGIGALLGSMFATSVGGREVVLWGSSRTVPGWRFALLVVGGVSIALGALIPFAMTTTDTRGDRPGTDKEKKRISGLRLIRSLCRVRTFQLIVLQGLFGAIPWNALSFATLWLQKIGYPDIAASAIVSWHTFGAGLGTVLGGKLGDMAAVQYPATGRVRVAQLSKSLSIVTAYMIFNAFPVHQNVSLGFALSVSFFSLGLVSSWTRAGVNRPILSEVVPSSQRASIMAWSISLEGCSAALLGAPVVGVLAERVFGYGSKLESTDDALALSRAMQCMIVIPWVVCFTAYGWVALVYDRDRQEARRKHATEVGR